MKVVQLSQVPDGLFTITRIVNMAIITMYDNVQAQTKLEGEDLSYSADQYQIKIPWRDGLENLDLNTWLTRAKELEIASTIIDKRVARDIVI